MRRYYICFLMLPGFAVMLLSCASQPKSNISTFELYPANESASSLGVIVMEMTSHGTGTGEVAFVAPDGENYKGKYTTFGEAPQQSSTARFLGALGAGARGGSGP